MTRADIQMIITDCAHSTLSANRARAILAACKTVDEFISLSRADILAAYRRSAFGKSSYDLGPTTYSLIEEIQAKAEAQLHAEKRTEEAAATAPAAPVSPWFTREELELLTAFMIQYKIARVDVQQFKTFLETMEREKDTSTPNA